MKTKHTPGPWTVDEGISEDGPMICGPDGFLHVQVYGPELRAAADARLIAAAPGMFNALKDAYACLSKIKSETREMQITLETINSILKKAEGE